MATTPQQTQTGAVNFAGITDKLAAIIYLLNTSNLTASQIATGGAPFTGITDKEAAIIYLLTGAGGGGLGGNAAVIYTADPNTEGLKPADTTKPALAYSSDGSGPVFGWSVALQKWV